MTNVSEAHILKFHNVFLMVLEGYKGPKCKIYCLVSGVGSGNGTNQPTSVIGRNQIKGNVNKNLKDCLNT